MYITHMTYVVYWLTVRKWLRDEGGGAMQL